MGEKTVISIDAMGGDNAPLIVLDAVESVAAKRPDAAFLLFGQRPVLESLLATRPNAARASEVIHRDDVVAMDAKPAQAMRNRQSSMWGALEAVRDKRAKAAVSAGNTGALMAISMLALRTLEGVDRPAISALWPTPRGYSVLLDAGANVSSDARQLVAFAVMGEAYFRSMFKVERASIGLLNIGSEDSKGHEEIRDAARLLREVLPHLDFRGFIEGNDISAGAVDVVATDGFTGNVALKTAEGAARLVTSVLKESLMGSLLGRVGALIARGALLKLRARMDPRAANGGLFLGLNGLVLKSHGGADAVGFAVALERALALSDAHFLEEVAQSLKQAMQAVDRAQAVPANAADAAAATDLRSPETVLETH